MTHKMNDIGFHKARTRVLSEISLSSGIGTLSEKSLHRMIKLFIEEDESFHEVEFLGSVADIKRENQIYEIQTHSAERLVPKLKKFLPHSRVCVVLPVISRRIIRRIDKKTGEISAPKVSPKHENIFTALGEVYKIRGFLNDSNFSVRLVNMEAEEYNLVGAVRGKRKIDLLPTSLVSVTDLVTRDDYINAVPNIPNGTFTSHTLAKENKCPKRLASALAGVLFTLGIIERVGKDKNAYLYRKKEIEK